MIRKHGNQVHEMNKARIEVTCAQKDHPQTKVTKHVVTQRTLYECCNLVEIAPNSWSIKTM